MLFRTSCKPIRVICCMQHLAIARNSAAFFNQVMITLFDVCIHNVAGRSAYTATFELQGARGFVLSFFQHMAATRRTYNPLEDKDVIGITSYIDVGLRLVAPWPKAQQGYSRGQPGADEQPGLSIGAQWQVTGVGRGVSRNLNLNLNC